MRLKEYIQAKRIIADGAFGTYYMSLYGDGSKPEKGLAISNLPELANITAPERVIGIHTEYIEAGAQLIRTNTFASNTKSLLSDTEAVKDEEKKTVEDKEDKKAEEVPEEKSDKKADARQEGEV